MPDLHLQYALHTTSFAEQPLSDKTLSCFRKKCYDYEILHGFDLYHDCVKDLSSKIAKIMKLNSRIRRMDSMMIESNIRFLSWMELIYTCISKLVVFLIKNYPDKVTASLKHYADPNDYNHIFYHQRNDDMGTIIQTLLTDSNCLLDICKTDFEEIILVTDGGYDGQDNIALAKEKNIKLVTTALIGKEAPDILADFEFNEEGTKLLRCAAGYESVSQSYTKSTTKCRISFDRNHCVDCPYQKQCRPKIYKKAVTFITSKNASNRAKSQRYMQSEEFSNLAGLRNGVETIPANIRKNYHLDKLPSGKQRGKFLFGGKIAALNFRKLLGFQKGLGHYAPNPMLA